MNDNEGIASSVSLGHAFLIDFEGWSNNDPMTIVPVEMELNV